MSISPKVVENLASPTDFIDNPFQFREYKLVSNISSGVCIVANLVSIMKLLSLSNSAPISVDLSLGEGNGTLVAS